MPAIAAITINNGEATPVAKTFTPVEIDTNGVNHYADTTGGIPVGFPTISLSLKRNGNGTNRVRANIALPVLEVASGATEAGYDPAPSVAFIMRSNHEFILPNRSSTAQREDLLAFAKNLLADAVSEALVESMENIY